MSTLSGINTFADYESMMAEVAELANTVYASRHPAEWYHDSKKSHVWIEPHEAACSHCGKAVVTNDAGTGGTYTKAEPVFDKNGVFLDIVERHYCKACFDRMFSACVRCGSVHKKAEMKTRGRYRYCPDCYNRIFGECGVCHTIHKRAEMKTGPDGKQYCQACFDNVYARCAMCGHTHLKQDMTTERGEHYCTSCQPRIYSTCVCGTNVFWRDGQHMDDRTVCQRCYREVMTDRPIKEYSHKPYLAFYPRPEGEPVGGEHDMAADMDSDVLHMGLEDEMDYGGFKQMSAFKVLKTAKKGHVYIKSDGSLNNGFEIVSHPMTLDYHVNGMNWKEVFDKLKELGYHSDDTSTTGLHVHAKITYFGTTESKQVDGKKKLMLLNELVWDEMVKLSRRGNVNEISRYAKRYGYTGDPERLYRAAMQECNRYHAINIMPHHTVEFRIFKGTLNRDYLIATLQLVQAMMDYAKNTSMDTIRQTTWAKFVDSFRGKYPELERLMSIKGIMPAPTTTDRTADQPSITATQEMSGLGALFGDVR